MAVSDWALERRFNPSLVYAVLHGRRKALRGRSFEIAVALGLKARPCD
jgi:gp16 family phage-associated protein